MAKEPGPRLSAEGLTPVRSTARPQWSIIVPFKGNAGAKSRLGLSTADRAGLEPDTRRDLALAFLCDTVAAAQALRSVAKVVIVSSDPVLVATIPDIILLADPGQGLNAAVARGIAWARSVAPGNPVAALTGDLPCLLSEDLAAGLEAARRHRLAVVPDRSGTGSTMISALSGVPVTPHFGAQSCRAHVLAGHRPLTVPGFSTLRADVDTLEDLDQALRRGVGQHTRAVGPRSPALASSSDHGGLPLPYLSTA